jgi:hypothetical protein
MEKTSEVLQFLRRFVERCSRARGLAACLLVVAVLAPYHQILTGRAIPIPDDISVSDLADGEFPGRVEAARLVLAGELPVWTPRLYTGFPMGPDPLSLLLFVALPPALALGWLIAFLLVVAAIGTYLLARHLGASRSGAFLAGFAYAWSGFFVCQLRHLGVIGTVAYFPLALFCLEKAGAGGVGVARAAEVSARRRLAWLVAFGAVFGIQVLAGFPQSAYISALVYAALVVARAYRLLARDHRGIPARRRFAPAATLALGALAAVTAGALVGMVTVLPLWELGSVSDRSGAGGWQWATHFAYWPPNVLTFFVPYFNGDISNVTYTGNSIFWEDYGYVGLATVLLALLIAGVRVRDFVSGRSAASDLDARRKEHDFVVAFWALAAVVGFGLVLGPALPLYRLAFELVPGLATFRFPTRFLFVVELGIALLGGLGLTFVQRLVARRTPAERRRLVAALVGLVVVSATVADLVYNNQRQNPLADAGRWLATPATASIIRRSGEPGRVFAPGSRQRHLEVFRDSRGWSGDLRLYYSHREFLQPDSNLLHGIATLDGYAGIAPRWTVDLIGDHNRFGLIDRLYRVDATGLRTSPGFFDWLEALSVRWIIVRGTVDSDRAQLAGAAEGARVYRLPGALPRARIVQRARIVASMDEVRRLTAAGQFDPRREVLLHDPAAARIVASLDRAAVDGEAAGSARIVVDRATDVVIEANAPRGGLLVLADTFYPGWQATVDGREAPILRANVVQRAVALTPGTHRVVFTFRPRVVTVGLGLSALGIGLLVGAAFLLRFGRANG